MQEIHQLRTECRQQHKHTLLLQAKAGNRRAIAHLRSSASNTATEGSYLYRAGGLTKAVNDLHDFYVRKYDSDEAPIGEEHWRQARVRHATVPVALVTKKELERALLKCKSGVSAGLDGVTFEGLKALVQRDESNRLGDYFTALFAETAPLPDLWLKGKIVLLPKVARPQQPSELRPICLVPTLSRLFAKVAMIRLRAQAPSYEANQLACRPGVQVLDGILAAQSTMSLIKRITGKTAKVAKLDIKAAFDSVSHHAVYRWLMSCTPCAEALGIMRLCFGTSVQVGLGGLDKTLLMKRGIMQGSAFSADLFSRIMDWYLGPLLPGFAARCPEWEECVQGLPHFLIYADDLIIFADTEESLQWKVRQIVQTLKMIGLSVNPSKCKVLNDVSGTTPGVWLPSVAVPLLGEDYLLFLGVPLGHSPGPQLILSHLMRKANNTFFAFKRLLDQSSTPLLLRLQLFDAYVTSKWQWAAPCLYPDARSLKVIEGHKNTYLLSLCRVAIDPLLPWLDNLVSRRRAVRLMCRIAHGPDWRRMWLRRLWTYHGHLARSKILHPMRRLVSTCTLTNLRRGLRPSWILDLSIRKLQKVYTGLVSEVVRRDCPAWEIYAQDRRRWHSLQKAWLEYWLPASREPQATPQYLLDRQLVLLRRPKVTEQMYLRPARDVLDEPYPCGVLDVSELRDRKKAAIWLLLNPATYDCRAVVHWGGTAHGRPLCIQMCPPHPEVLAAAASLLTLGCKLVQLLRLFGYGVVGLVAPLAVLRRELFQETVPLHLLHDLSQLKQALAGLPTGCLYLQPQKLPNSVLLRVNHFSPVPLHTKYLVRTESFGTAYFGDNFRTVHAAVWEILGQGPGLPL